MIYEPREDSYLLEKEVRLLAKGLHVLDMGAASGIQAEAALDAGAERVLCVDIQEDVVVYLKKKGLNAIKSDLFSNVQGRFDLICFNPPYLPFDKREDKYSEVITSGGEKGDELLVIFLGEVGNYLEKEGIVLIVLSSLTPRARILNVLKEKDFAWKVVAKKKVFMEKLEVWRIREKI
jgi:release factor glutamine methyltransferase